MSLTDEIFGISHAIRYVAIYSEGALSTAQRPDLRDASASESDRYEELLVNPTLLTLSRQRGNIDCGGLRFVIVGYGHFNQLVVDLPHGHVSICFELDENPITHFEMIKSICLRHSTPTREA